MKEGSEHVFLGGVNDLGQMLRRTFECLLNESVDKPWRQQSCGTVKFATGA